MLVNQMVLDNLYKDSGEKRKEKAIEYQKSGRVKINDLEYENDINFEISAIVGGSDKSYKTYIEIKNGNVEDVTCTCKDYYNHYGICKHTLASVLELNNNPQYLPKRANVNEEAKKAIKKLGEVLGENEDKNQAYRNFKQLVNTFYREEVEDINDNTESIKVNGNIKLEPIIFYDKFLNEMKVEFKIGTSKRMYKIKNLADFYTRMIEKEYYKYGESLEFIHTKEEFSEESQKLLEFLMKYAEIIKYANSNANSNYRYYGKALNESTIVVGNSGVDDLFDTLKGQKVNFKRDYMNSSIEFTEEQPNIKFILKKKENGNFVIFPNVEIYEEIILKGRKYKYILDEKKLYRCSKEFEKTNLRLLELFKQNYMAEIEFSKNKLADFFSVIMPKVKNAIIMQNIPEKEIEKYRPKELVVKVYLDFDKSDYLVADVRFCYDNNEFNPIEENVSKSLVRNKIKETKSLNMLRKTGFMLDVKNKRFILPNDDDIYRFLTQDINYYMKNFEVMVTDNFKAKQIRTPKMASIGVKVENDLLSIDLSKMDIDTKELKNIMDKYALKKKYYRLKDGSFIELQENKEIEFLDKLSNGMDIDYDELEGGEVHLPVSRTLYLNQILNTMKGSEIIKNSEYKKIVNELDKDQISEEIEIPKKLNTTLRYYQKTGFQWLRTLDKYHFGGILADDMGLGKTVQMLSVLVDYVEKSGKRASLVVSPSSLTLNWLNEITKFTKDLKTEVIRGTLAERKKQIEDIDKYDVIITSYDLLKRDIESYKEKDYQFRFVIADEAQYLKNSSTKNAKAIKQIKSDTRYALTGTPIENSLSELWSIFDFIMPGYLFTYRRFKNMYEMPIVKKSDERAMKKLKMLIEPFILRRNKKEVLTELPDKTVTVLNNEMNEEQQKIYLTYLAQAKQDLMEQIELNGYEHSHMQILAALTRLRQICCHPSLFMEGYNEGSSKLDQCMEIIQDAINGGHKILLFSGYTSMFEIIEKELKKLNISYFKLIGSTKVEDRIKLVDEFNENPEIKVFLISLKAGGTGLNLTGADMVIHYDPWWNISTENQATDRAYRIGQKNNVQVYKLITKNSIEEKIYNLQERKAELANNMLNTKTKFISQLSKDEIMNLFE